MPTPLDVFIIAGQSNAAGKGDANTSPSVTGDSIMWTNTASAWATLDDPLFVDELDRGSAWPAFANAYETETGVPCALIMTAWPGAGLIGSNWQSTIYDTAISRANTAIAAFDAETWTPTVRGILWHQGEADAQNYAPVESLEAAYEAALVDLLDRFEESLSLSLSLYVFRVGRPSNSDTAGFAAVRAAQDAAALSDPRIVMVYERCVDFADLGWMSDSLHYTQDGYDDMGGTGALAAAAAINNPPAPAPPASVALKVNNSPGVVTVAGLDGVMSVA